MMKRPWHRALYPLPVLLASLAVALPAPGQQVQRETAIGEAEFETDFERAFGLLRPALDPNLAGRDSLWMEGVRVMAVVLLDENMGNADRRDPGLAPVWLRWGLRHGGRRDLQIFAPRVKEVFDRVLDQVTADDLGGTGVETEWDWGSTTDPSAEGRVEVVAGSGVDAGGVVRIDGGDAEPGGTTALAPGTYRVEWSAPGYEPVAVEREVLPGVTTRLRVEPVPVFTDDLRAQVSPRLLQIGYGQGASRICADALRVGESVVAVRRGPAETGEMELVGVEGGLRGAALQTDAAGLSLVRTSSPAAAVWPRGTTAAGDYAWAVYRPGCGAQLADTRVRIERIESGAAVFDTSVPEEAVGGALVDRVGALLGSVSAVDRAVLFTPAVQRSLEQAILALNVEEEQAESSAGGGLPWKWIGGIGAVGAGAAFLAGGGGGGNGGTDPDPTGEIVVVIPGG